MTRLTAYVFHSVWQVPGTRAVVFDVLSDLESYPLWWPEVRAVQRLDEHRFETRCRSTLPYDLVFVTAEGHRDVDTGVIEGLLTGDLDGFSRWQIDPDPASAEPACTLTYDQEVATRKQLLSLLAPVARPAFRANHALMMRHGEAGLRTYLAGVLHAGG